MSPFEPTGVIPACLLPFDGSLSIDESAYRRHLRDVTSVTGISAITINGHAAEVHALSFAEQRRLLEVTRDEVGSALPIVQGVYATASIEGARIARMVAAGNFPIEKVITARIAAEDVVDKGFEALLDPAGEHLKIMVTT